MRVLRSFGGWVLTAGIAMGVGAVAGAQSTQPAASSSSGPYGAGSGGLSNGSYGSGMGRGGLGQVTPATVDNMGTEDAPLNPQMQRNQAKMRNIQRQKELVSDTQKLVALVNELQTDVSKSNKDMLSLDVIRKADEIEKLAHSVREKMKNAN
ncbi:MAG TPA: hypothetical protein VG714_08105 [Acidobacteriaceae bacterium]|nr:hypothetical protein [Acidobacteriaceae bacterium]